MIQLQGSSQLGVSVYFLHLGRLRAAGWSRLRDSLNFHVAGQISCSRVKHGGVSLFPAAERFCICPPTSPDFCASTIRKSHRASGLHGPFSVCMHAHTNRFVACDDGGPRSSCLVSVRWVKYNARVWRMQKFIKVAPHAGVLQKIESGLDFWGPIFRTLNNRRDTVPRKCLYIYRPPIP